MSPAPHESRTAVFFKSELGQTAIEYALIIVGVSMVMVAVMTGFAAGLVADADSVISGWLS